MKHYFVVPAIHLENTLGFLGSMDESVARERVILIDNTEKGDIANACTGRVAERHYSFGNLGVAASWNLGCRMTFDRGAEYATLTSTSMRLRPDGGRGLCVTADFAAENTQWPYGFESLNGWHLITIGRRLFEEVGEFDENFRPGYMEDTDYVWRMRVAGVLEPVGEPRHDRKLPWVPTLRYECVGDAHALQNTDIEVDWAALSAYYERKWGGQPGAELFRSPFDEDHITQRDTAHGQMATWDGYRGDMEYPVVKASPHQLAVAVRTAEQGVRRG